MKTYSLKVVSSRTRTPWAILRSTLYTGSVMPFPWAMLIVSVITVVLLLVKLRHWPWGLQLAAVAGLVLLLLGIFVLLGSGMA
jgi:hypothetical protein